MNSTKSRTLDTAHHPQENTGHTEAALPIVETFHSVQGEGFWTGASAFFIQIGRASCRERV